jgi:predicted enzyme related to lactoylglutathione lyase
MRGEAMPVSVGYLVIDTTDPARLTPFWCGLLEVEIDTMIGDGQFVVLSPTKDGLTIGFQLVPEAKTGKNRLHLDLIVEDLDGVTAEIETLGGRWLEPGNTRELEGFRWRLMADPEGNEFDIDVLPPS